MSVKLYSPFRGGNHPHPGVEGDAVEFRLGSQLLQTGKPVIAHNGEYPLMGSGFAECRNTAYGPKQNG